MEKFKVIIKKLTIGELKQYDRAKKQGSDITQRALRRVSLFCRQNWIGAVVILGATLLFFWPIVTRIDSYSEGGDAMFNAWTLARNHHCIIGQGCPDYTDGNIYYPHEDTMLYSETQLSAGLLTLPLFLINDNPIFAYNIWTIASVFFAGFFMYLLAKYLSRGNEWVSILAGLIFAFAPFKMAAIFHLQNLSIFYLPLAILLVLKYFDTKKRAYLWWLLVVLILLFYASWYNLVFSAVALALLLGGYLLFRLANLKKVLAVAGIIGLAGLATLPLAVEFMRFSKETGANFSIKDQLLYQSSLMDYVLPHDGTLVGKIFYAFNPDERRNAFNLDSFSYHGIILYILAGALLVLVFINRKKSKEAFKKFGAVITFAVIGVVGFILSLGPLLKVKGNYIYGSTADGIGVAMPLPYLFIDKFIPQLTFIRGVGRWSVLFLLALCCLLAYLAYYVAKNKTYQKYKIVIGVLVSAIIFVELMPLHQVTMSKNDYSYNLRVPQVYQFIKERPEINNLIVLRGDEDYPNAPIPIARAEDILWSGYHNRNIFNGYSGYTPSEYFNQYWDFIDFEADDIDKMRKLGIRYLVVDKQLSVVKNTHMPDAVKQLVGNKLYEDERYSLHRLQ
jgi:hypothetical protein